jgi:hypothetical protein
MVFRKPSPFLSPGQFRHLRQYFQRKVNHRLTIEMEVSLDPEALINPNQKNNWPGGGGTRPVGERRKWYMNFD